MNRNSYRKRHVKLRHSVYFIKRTPHLCPSMGQRLLKQMNCYTAAPTYTCLSVCKWCWYSKQNNQLGHVYTIQSFKGWQTSFYNGLTKPEDFVGEDRFFQPHEKGTWSYQLVNLTFLTVFFSPVKAQLSSEEHNIGYGVGPLPVLILSTFGPASVRAMILHFVASLKSWNSITGMWSKPVFSHLSVL